MSEKEKDKEKKHKPEGAHPKGEKGGGGGEKGHKGGGGQKQSKKPKPQAAQEQETAEDSAPAQPAPPARLYERFKSEIIPALQQKLGFDNKFAVPRLEKIVVSMGLGRFATEGGEGKAKFQQGEQEL